MARFVALWHGINVGAAKRLAMADLRRVLEALGLTGVKTLLNSGNAVFEAATDAGHAKRIRAAVREALGVDAEVIVKRGADIAGAVAENPLPERTAAPSKLLVAFTSEARQLAALGTLAGADGGEQRIVVGRHAAYAWCGEGVLGSRAGPALLAALKGQGTTRNWATVAKIHALLEE